MDFEFNPQAAMWGGILSALFIAMVWLVPTWQLFPFKQRIAITIFLPIIGYFMADWQLNK